MNCERFRDAVEGDRKLSRAVEEWKKSAPAPPPSLEARIAAAIARDGRAAGSTKTPRGLSRHAAWVAMAASLILAVWVGSQLGSPGRAEPTSLEQVISQADQARVAYLRSIADLERRVTPLLERAADPDLPPTEAALLLRYRDRLSHLDTVIAEVQLFLDDNPGHSSGHTVLLAAYQDKQQVLVEILQTRTGERS